MTVDVEPEAAGANTATVRPDAEPAEHEVKGVAENVSSAGSKVLPASSEIVPFSPDFVSVHHDVLPADQIW